MIKRDLPETRCGWRYKNQILDKMHETDISIRRQARLSSGRCDSCSSNFLLFHRIVKRSDFTLSWHFFHVVHVVWEGSESPLCLVQASCVSYSPRFVCQTAEQSEFIIFISNGLGKFCPHFSTSFLPIFFRPFFLPHFFYIFYLPTEFCLIFTNHFVKPFFHIQNNGRTFIFLFCHFPTTFFKPFLPHPKLVFRPENWQQIVDELLEILGASDSLLQEETAGNMCERHLNMYEHIIYIYDILYIYIYI